MVFIFTIHISYKTLTRRFPGWFCNNQIYGVGVMHTVNPKKNAHGFVVLCFVVVMQSFIMNSHEVFIHIHQGCFAGTGAIVRLPQCQWSKPDGYGKISQCITTTKHSKAKTVCIFLGIYCICVTKVSITVSDKVLSPTRHHDTTCTSFGLLLIILYFIDTKQNPNELFNHKLNNMPK